MSKRERDRDRELKLKTESQNQTPSTACFTLATAKERDSIFYGNVDSWFIMTFVSFRFRWFNLGFYHHLYANIITRIGALCAVCVYSFALFTIVFRIILAL